jgi:hypothetical protein
MCRVNAGAVAFFDFEECERWLEEVWATQRILFFQMSESPTGRKNFPQASQITARIKKLSFANLLHILHLIYINICYTKQK